MAVGPGQLPIFRPVCVSVAVHLVLSSLPISINYTYMYIGCRACRTRLVTVVNDSFRTLKMDAGAD